MTHPLRQACQFCGRNVRSLTACQESHGVPTVGEVKSWIRNQKGAEGEISSTTKAWVLPKNKKMSQAEDDMDFRWF